ncbi:hypothetical protein F4Y93_07140 [Candidatus Poribacteria bacterium]|nr:hypothetical protein [Candidatus Poribacteria bacterium]
MPNFQVFVFLSLFYFFFLPSSFAQGITQWRLPEGSETPFGKTVINTTVFSPDGARLAVATTNGIVLYDTDTGTEVAILPALMDTVTALAFSPDNQTLANARADATLHLWNIHTGEHIADFTGHTYPIVSLAFSPDGKTLASGSFREIRLWDLRTELPVRAAVLHGHRDMVTTLAFSPDNQTLASTSFYGTILLWDIETSQRRHNLAAHTDSILALAFSPDGLTLASGGYWSPDTESTIRVWDIPTGELLKTFEGHAEPIFALAFTPTSDSVYGNTLVSAGWDNTIRLWNPQTAELKGTFEGDTAPVLAVAFLQGPSSVNVDTRRTTLASAGLDGTIQLWSLTSVSRPLDVNADGVINVLDLTFVAAHFGQATPDLNGDGIVNILDLVLVARHFEN